MGECVAQHGKPAFLARGRAETRLPPAARGACIRKFGRRPQSAPDAAGRAAAQQQPPVVHDEHHLCALLPPRRTHAARRQRVDEIQRARRATVCERTAFAVRPARVQSVAPRSMIACVYSATCVSGVQASARAQSRAVAPPIRRLTNRENARQHTLHVAVKYRMSLAVREREDGARRRFPDARKRHQRFQCLGQDAAVARDDILRRAMQVASTRVVAEPGPEREHLVF